MSGTEASPQPQPDDPASDPATLTPSQIAADSVRLEEQLRSARHEGPGRSVLGSAVVVSAATSLSRVTGLLRDVLTAALFGFSREMDAFFLAFTLPNLFRKLFGEGALSAAMIPVLAGYRLRGDMQATRRLLGTMATLLGLGLGAVVVLGLGVIWLLPSGWLGDAHKYERFREYSTILLPYVIFICLSALQTGALNCWHRFGGPALMPALANVIWVAVLVGIWYSPLRGDPHAAVLVMAAGVLLSGVAQWVAQMPGLARTGLLSRPRLSLSEPGIKETFKAMAPMLFALAVFQVNTFLDQLLAELLVPGDGAVSAYSYASRLFQFPLGLVAVALSTAMFPLMSRFAQSNELDKLTASLLNSARLLAFIALPSAAGLAALAWPITTLLFSGAGSTPAMLERTGTVVAMLCLSLPLVSVISVLTRGFYALRDQKTPTRVGLVAVVVNLVCNVVLLQTPLLEAGLALGTAISGAVNLTLLALALRKRLRGTVLDSMRAGAIPPTSERLAQPFSPSKVRAIPAAIARSAAVSGVMALAAWAAEAALRGRFGLTGRWSLALSVSGGVVAGVVVYAGLSLLLKAPEVEQILSLRKRRSGGGQATATKQ
ncbi:MAG: murein biosynthesis integral membrane protein MurJ [Planctomycetes bacterium]|nr:murein biosynthesis integral membrane protein MurJ [Planctomycetota bacterium]